MPRDKLMQELDGHILVGRLKQIGQNMVDVAKDTLVLNAGPH